jgi:single-strand DNA-binding protein
MKGINKAIIVGQLGNDPDVKHLPSGDAVVNISVATSEKWKDKTSGEYKEVTEWHRVVMFRKLADIAAQYLTKGAKVYLEGKIKTRKWKDKEGNERYSTEIEAYEMQMLDGKQGGDSPPPPKAVVVDDDDIPF